MDRRDFLLAAGCTTLASATIGKPLPQAYATPLPAAGAPLALTMEGAGTVDWATGQARELATRIEQASGGRYAVSVLESSSVKAAPLKLLRASRLVEIDRAFAFATGLPGTVTLDAESSEAWLTGGGGQAALDELAASHGLKVLLAAHGGESFLWSSQPLLTAADFAGKCVQAEGLACHVAAGLGAEPWRIVPETASAGLVSGAIAAIEASVPEAISQGLLQTARYASTNAFAPGGNALALTIDLDAWRAMRASDQATMTSATLDNYRESVRLNRLAAGLNRRALQQTCAIEVSPVSQGLAAQIQTVARAVIAQTAASSPVAAKLNASYMNSLKSRQDFNAHSPTV